MSALKIRRVFASTLALGLLFGAAACGGSDGDSRIAARLFSWTSEQEFAFGVDGFAEAHTIRISVTQPSTRTILKQSSFAVADGGAHLPDLSADDGLRMEFEVRSIDGRDLAWGSTPTFGFNEAASERLIRTMVSPVNDFAPVGSVVRNEMGDEVLVESHFDGRLLAENWGRVGHTADLTESGKVLVVGGGQVGAFHQPATMPNLNAVHADIQLFDPVTGYFTELGGDEASLAADVRGVDRLDDGRAFHTVTALGEDRFLVVGGFTVRNGTVLPLRSIELIDLKAAPGMRVQPVMDLANAPIQLQGARGLHSATLRSSDGAVVIAGGLDDGSPLNSFEVIHPREPNALVESGLNMQVGRVGHSAVLMEDGTSVWLIGGRTSEIVLASTEVISVGAAGTISSPAASLSRPRYAASAHHLGAARGNFVVVIGGFTGLTGGATATYEIGRPEQVSLAGENEMRINLARGAAAIYELPLSRDLLVIGGLTPEMQVIPSVERLRFQRLEDLVPFAVDEPAGSMYQRRSGFAGVGISNGRYMLIGGQEPGSAARSNAEYFNPRDPVIPRR